jgi:hypothetical protein
MASPVYQAWVKAIRTDGTTPGYSASWLMAHRGWLYVFPDRIECGDTVISAEGSKEAVLYEARQWFIPVHILAVTTANGTWQFGLNPWAKIASHLPFAFRRERVRLRYSAFSIAIRAALIAYVVYLVFRRFAPA